MSSSMSRSRVKWASTALSAAAAAVMLPAVASAAGSLTVNLSLAPLGGTAPFTTAYTNPGLTSTVYVYATVTDSTGPLSSSEIAGLQYLYYNITNTTAGTGSAQATIATINNAANADFTGDGTSGVDGSQVGVLNPSAGLTLGGTLPTAYAKPRAAGPVFSYNSSAGASTSDGTNIYVSGNSVSFLVEKLSVTAPGTAVSSTGATTGTGVFAYSTSPGGAGNLNETTFGVSVPSLTLPLTGSNYFTDLTSSGPYAGGTLAAHTSNNSATAGTSVTLINTLPGDANDDGIVNNADFLILAGHINQTGQTWATGDFTGDGIVNNADFLILASHINLSLGVTPAQLVAEEQFAASNGFGAAFDAAIAANPTAVPEPASAAVLMVGSGLALLRRRRNRV